MIHLLFVFKKKYDRKKKKFSWTRQFHQINSNFIDITIFILRRFHKLILITKQPPKYHMMLKNNIDEPFFFEWINIDKMDVQNRANN